MLGKLPGKVAVEELTCSILSYSRVNRLLNLAARFDTLTGCTLVPGTQS